MTATATSANRPRHYFKYNQHKSEQLKNYKRYFIHLHTYGQCYLLLCCTWSSKRSVPEQSEMITRHIAHLLNNPYNIQHIHTYSTCKYGVSHNKNIKQFQMQIFLLKLLAKKQQTPPSSC